MILGWSWADAAPPSYTATRCGGVAMLSGPQLPDGAREISLVQIALARQLESFLPATASFSQDLSRAAAWTQAHLDDLNHLLSALNQTSQITVAMRMPLSQAEPLASGTGWLRYRAQKRRRKEQDQGTALAILKKGLCATDVRKQRVRPFASGFALDLLTSKEGVSETLARLERNLGANGPSLLQGWSCAIAAPLPVYSFADLG